MAPFAAPSISPARTVAELLVAVAVLMVLYLFLFSELGFGATIFKALVRNDALSVPLAAAGGLALFLFYLVDFDTGSAAANHAICVLVGVSMVVAAVLCFQSMPHAPLMASMVTAAAYFSAIYVCWFHSARGLPVVAYLQALSKALVLGGAGMLLAVCVWAGVNNCWWGRECQDRMRAAIRVCKDASLCEPTRFGGDTCPGGCEEDPRHSVCEPEIEHCLGAFMLWASPFIAAVMATVLGAALYVVAEEAADIAVRAQEKQQGGGEGGEGGEGEGGGVHACHHSSMFIKTCVLLFFLIWIGASVAGHSMDLAGVLVNFGFFGLLLMCGVLCLAVGMDSMKTALGEVKVLQKLMTDEFWSDLMRAVAVMVGGPVFVLVLPLAHLKQGLRRRMHADYGQVTALWIVEAARRWRWSSVLSKCVTLGVAYFLMEAIVKVMTTMFLAWLNAKLVVMHLAAICVVILAIALALFAIPVVPGVPAYVACGVTIGAAGERSLGSFAAAMVLAVVMALVCKLLACLMQQKLFGEMLGKSVAVRSTVGVNSQVRIVPV